MLPAGAKNLIGSLTVPTVHLTQRAIAKLAAPTVDGRQTIYWDDELRGFESVKLSDIRAVLERYPLDRVTTLALGPLAKLHAPGGNGVR